MPAKPKKHKFVFIADDSLRRRIDAMLKKETFRAVANDRSDILRLALVEYLERHESAHAHSPAAATKAPRKAADRAPKPYTLGPNAVPA